MDGKKWTPQRVRVEGWPERVCGIPAILVVTAKNVDGEGGFEWAIYDRRGHEAEWLWDKMWKDGQERLRLEDVVRDKLVGWGPQPA